MECLILFLPGCAPSPLTIHFYFLVWLPFLLYILECTCFYESDLSPFFSCFILSPWTNSSPSMTNGCPGDTFQIFTLLAQLFWKILWHDFEELNIYLYAVWPSNSTPRYKPKSNSYPHVPRDTWENVHSSLFRIAKKYKNKNKDKKTWKSLIHPMTIDNRNWIFTQWNVI